MSIFLKFHYFYFFQILREIVNLHLFHSYSFWKSCWTSNTNPWKIFVKSLQRSKKPFKFVFHKVFEPCYCFTVLAFWGSLLLRSLLCVFDGTRDQHYYHVTMNVCLWCWNDMLKFAVCGGCFKWIIVMCSALLKLYGMKCYRFKWTVKNHI